jgi:hypothetical protein
MYRLLKVLRTLLPALLVTGLAAAATSSAVPAYLAAAIANPSRPAEDVARDADRKPAATLMFAGVAPGEQIAELLPGGGYFTRIMSKAVGANGHIYALVPAPRADAPANAPDFAARVKALAADPAYANVSVVVEPFAELKTPCPWIWYGRRRTITTCIICRDWMWRFSTRWCSPRSNRAARTSSWTTQPSPVPARARHRLYIGSIRRPSNRK